MSGVEVTPGAINVRCWVMAGPGAAALSYTMETGQMIIVLSSHDLWILGTSSCTLSAGATIVNTFTKQRTWDRRLNDIMSQSIV